MRQEILTHRRCDDRFMRNTRGRLAATFYRFLLSSTSDPSYERITNGSREGASKFLPQAPVEIPRRCFYTVYEKSCFEESVDIEYFIEYFIETRQQVAPRGSVIVSRTSLQNRSAVKEEKRRKARTRKLLSPKERRKEDPFVSRIFSRCRAKEIFLVRRDRAAVRVKATKLRRKGKGESAISVDAVHLPLHRGK